MQCRNDRGASAVEYGLLIAGIAAVVAIVVVGLGQAVGHRLSDNCDEIGGHIQTALAQSGSTGCTP
ncbi:Flp family type IVb pilin [Nocardioides sp. CER19]|uniref:Flp family type IVb pilin n=1 Tax=Nocardioides sp. CER19 TaxID=3038538 RepID=UPI00244A19A8|nr:Flp family type IVb pilin [Nocardioides sp. CER19]MDH2416760.1 Flp family type IVb pilin [Nocardioides sp. CER19]